MFEATANRTNFYNLRERPSLALLYEEGWPTIGYPFVRNHTDSDNPIFDVDLSQGLGVGKKFAV